jgi:peptide/nickel transport system permease protein
VSVVSQSVGEPQAGAAAWTQQPRRKTRRWGTIVAGAVFAALVLGALIAPFFLADPTLQTLGAAMKAPSLHGGHLLGTDSLGEDELSRLMTGLRTTLEVAFVSVVIGGTFGTLVGTISGYVSGVVDEIVMRLADVQLSIPAVLLAITLVSALHPSVHTVILVLSLYIWVVFGRVARAQVLAIRNTDLIAASRAIGASTPRIIVRHVLPNIAGPIVALATVQFANLAIIEAALGYLGIGVPPPTPTIGGMIAEGQGYLTTGQWWLTLNPGVVLVLVVVCVNYLGDAVRDRFDPRTRRAPN